jgi:hypothetical protein
MKIRVNILKVAIEKEEAMWQWTVAVVNDEMQQCEMDPNWEVDSCSCSRLVVLNNQRYPKDTF